MITDSLLSKTAINLLKMLIIFINILFIIFLLIHFYNFTQSSIHKRIYSMSQNSQHSPTLIQKPYGPKIEVVLDFPPGFGRTKQSFKDETDINNIMAKFRRTGVLEFANKNEARYGDTTGLEFNHCMNIIATGKTMFAEMPSALRARFKNDPAEFLDFVHNEDNRAEAQALGLLKPAAAPAAPIEVILASPSHREDGSASHEPLRASDGTFREHTRKEKRAEAAQQKAADAAKDQ